MAKAYDINQVAEKLKVSKYNVKKLIKEGKLKAFKMRNKYIVNEISLLVFMGHKIEECINSEEFEQHYSEINKSYNRKIDKEKFYEYFCSLFTLGPELTSEHFLINETNSFHEEQNYNKMDEQQSSGEVTLTHTDIINILESLSKIQQILQSKLK